MKKKVLAHDIEFFVVVGLIIAFMSLMDIVQVPDKYALIAAGLIFIGYLSLSGYRLFTSLE